MTGTRYITYGLMTKLARSRWLDIGQVLFFACLWTETKDGIKHQSMICVLAGQSPYPERARYLYLARSGSQSQRKIRFILPTHGARHIIRYINRDLSWSTPIVVYLNNRVFLSRNYRLIVAPRKFDVLKTNICPRSEASRENMLVLRTSNFQGATIRPIVPRHKHSIVFIVHH